MSQWVGMYIFKEHSLDFRQNNRTKLNKDLIAKTTQVLKSCDIISDKWHVFCLNE